MSLVVGCREEPRRPRFTEAGAGLIGVSRCSLAWGDYDGDGDLDLAAAGWTEGLGPASKVYRNEGSGVFADIEAVLTGVEFCSLAWGDHDNDGDLDLALAGWWNQGVDEGYETKICENDQGVFTEIGVSLHGVGSCSIGWGDYDGDGDLDLALAGYDGNADVGKIYRNEGSGAFGQETAALLMGISVCSLAWGDYDSDGDLDLAIAGYASGGPVSKVYRNNGGGLFADIGAGLTGVWESSLAWGDYDSDGDLDLALAGESESGNVSKVYRNDGDGNLIDIGANLDGVERCSLAWGDFDNDGDPDLALAGSVGSLRQVSKIYRNDGGETFTEIDAGLTGVDGCSLAWGDYDSDGDLDLALAGMSDNGPVAKIYHNNAEVANTVPEAPVGLSFLVLGSDVLLSWNAAADAETPASGLTYNLKVRSESGGEDDVMPCHSDPATGKRRLPAMGNVQHNTSWTLKLPSGKYHWSVQAVDTAFEGSPWATEQTVTVP